MIYEQDKLASEIKKYLLECKLGDAYIESFRDLVPAGGKIPGIRAVLDNHRLRDHLTCFLMYRSSLLSDRDRKQGVNLADKLDEVGAVRKADKKEEMAEVAWELNDVMKETDFIQYLDAGYMRAGDNQSDPVRRLYRDIGDREKRQDIIDYLETVLEKGHSEKIMALISSLENITDKVPARSGKVR